MHYTAEQLETAVANARAETEVRVAAAVTAERERFAAILKLPAAAGKEAQAVAIAASGVSCEQAAAILQIAQPDRPAANIPGRSQDAPGGLVMLDPACVAPNAPASAGAWGKAIARVNQQVDKQIKARTNG